MKQPTLRDVRAIAWILLGAVLLGPLPLRAHDGPEHEIEELTNRLKRSGESADLYLERAIEYQLLGKLAEAARDLERAIELEPLNVPAHRELGRVYFRLGKTPEALTVLGKGLSLVSSPAEQATLLISRAEVLLSKNENAKSLEDASSAIEKHPTNVEWYLLRSRLQARLGQHEARVRGLEEGVQRTGSGVLQVEMSEALIDAKQFERVMEQIEKALVRARWRSSWLIRRARVLAATGKTAEAAMDLEESVLELDRRINSAAPEPSLLADRGRAYDLLGKRDLARSDYESAKSRGVDDDWVVERLKVFKKEAEEAAKR